MRSGHSSYAGMAELQPLVLDVVQVRDGVQCIVELVRGGRVHGLLGFHGRLHHRVVLRQLCEVGQVLWALRGLVLRGPQASEGGREGGREGLRVIMHPLDNATQQPRRGEAEGETRLAEDVRECTGGD